MDRSAVTPSGPAARDETVLIQGVKIAYTHAGHGNNAVLLVHGGAGTRRDWRKAIQYFATDRQVFVPDLIGYGDSDRPLPRYTVAHLADSLLGFIDAVGAKRASLVGHSLGARACLEVARRSPDRVERLVLVAPMGFGRLSALGMALGTTAWALYNLSRRPLPYPKLDIRLNDPDLRAALDIQTPTLVVWGRWDPFFPSSHAPRVRRAIPQARVELMYLSGHSPHKSQATRFNQLASDFLNGAESGLHGPRLA